MKTTFALALIAATALAACSTGASPRNTSPEVAGVTKAKAPSGDTVGFAGAQLLVPDGWRLQQSGPVATLLPAQRGGFIELYRFSRLPKAELSAITAIMEPRRGTTDINVEQARPSAVGGAQGTMAAGTVRIKGAKVLFRLVALPAGDHAVVAVSFVQDGKAALEASLEAVLSSLRPLAGP